MTTAAKFAPLRDTIVERLQTMGYWTEAEAIADAAVLAHVKAIRNRHEVCEKMVEKLDGKGKVEALVIFLALEAEAIRRHAGAFGE